MSYYISPRFLDKLSVHITKNFLSLPNVRAPLILGVHGRKGEGKSFQCDLVFERMGIEAVYMSAGELESPDAGDPARLIRMRYLEAGEYVKVRGKMAVLLINDFDAGAGRVDQFTQYTVNTQLVHGTLMNIADNPTNVQLPGSYNSEPTQRIPIILTGNDFSTLYAPLTRDGRMDKFFWEPDRADRVGIVGGIFEVDQVAKSDIEKLVDQFPDQAIDFYGALRSRLYDEQIRRLIEDVGIDRISQRVVNSNDRPPEFRKPDFSLSHLIEVGTAMVREQKRLQELRLVEEYNQTVHNRGLGEIKMAPQPVHNGATVTEPVRSQSAVQASSSYNGQPSSNRLTPEIVSEVNRILGQGQRLGIEVVDARRFRTNSWNCYGMFEGDGAAAISALESCLDENQKNYVRIVGIRDRQRVIETIVHRPS
ncbi:AAA family ATPase [Leptolyngbya sp. FACHB-17]|uniref:AAA family ATPase n=1 Tax=unclassified Leptolyngbya TaxID=2650499 RepID=UPI0016812FBA|nr:AAA family ATPase [Leptolyngbya sp. FACHB-17]MBD2082152.1 AAA family ATPase [Leptolyngbya sp. FACHB-17]